VPATLLQGIAEGAMNLEATKGASHAADAAAAFVDAVQRHLPRKALEEIRELSRDQVRQWAQNGASMRRVS
jgi:hypothetical protein